MNWYNGSNIFPADPLAFRFSDEYFRSKWQHLVIPRRPPVWQPLSKLRLNGFSPPSYFLGEEPISDLLVQILETWAARISDWQRLSLPVFIEHLAQFRERVHWAQEFIKFLLISPFRGGHDLKLIEARFPCALCRTRNLRVLDPDGEPSYPAIAPNKTPYCAPCQIALRLVEAIINIEKWRVDLLVSLKRTPPRISIDSIPNQHRLLTPDLWDHIFSFVEAPGVDTPIPVNNLHEPAINIAELIRVTQNHLLIATGNSFSYPCNLILTNYLQATRDNRLEPWRDPNRAHRPNFSYTVIDYSGLPECEILNNHIIHWLTPLAPIADPHPLFLLDDEGETEFPELDSDDENSIFYPVPGANF